MRSMLGNRGAIALFARARHCSSTRSSCWCRSVWSLGYTFTKGNVISGFTFTGFDNYRKLVDDDSSGRRCGSPSSTRSWSPSGRSCSATPGAALHLLPKRASALIRTLVFFPVVLPTVAVAADVLQRSSRSPRRPAWSTPCSAPSAATATGDWFGGAGTRSSSSSSWTCGGRWASTRCCCTPASSRSPKRSSSRPASTARPAARLVRHVVLPLLAAGAAVVGHVQHQRHPQGLRLDRRADQRRPGQRRPRR